MTNKFSRLDMSRRERLGMVEAIWGEHKTVEQISSILTMLEKTKDRTISYANINFAYYSKKINDIITSNSYYY